ncbi:MAG: DUF192 domain-containing protein [bacterium]|nr:DUF192 domain-containing protein [bacterium]
MSGYNDGTIALGNKVVNIEIADTIDKQRLGLGGREVLRENEGMLFVYDQALPRRFWMKGMLIPIDMIWMNDNQVVDISASVQPQPGAADHELEFYSPSSEADKVLEVTSGWAERNDIKIGDEVKFNLP